MAPASSPSNPAGSAPAPFPPHARFIAEFLKNRRQLGEQGVTHEMGLRGAFQALLDKSARERGYLLIPEPTLRTAQGATIRPDGAVHNAFGLPRGYWESKDPDDDLDREIRAKIKAGYPTHNIIFENSQTAILYQRGQALYKADLANPEHIAVLLTQFHNFAEPHIAHFEQAVAEFSARVPELGSRLADIIQRA
jgi:hypothetical protein